MVNFAFDDSEEELSDGQETTVDNDELPPNTTMDSMDLDESMETNTSMADTTTSIDEGYIDNGPSSATRIEDFLRQMSTLPQSTQMHFNNPQNRLDGDKIRVMQSSLFRSPIQETSEQIQPFPAISSALKTKTVVSHVEPSEFYVALPAMPNKYTRVPQSSSVTNTHEGSIIDSLSFSRKFKVRWSNDGRLISLGQSSKSNSEVNTSTQVIIQPIKWDDTSISPNNLLKTLEEHTSIEMDYLGIPSASPSQDLRFSHLLSSQSSNKLWSLGHALFDEIPDLAIPLFYSPAKQAHIIELRRIERLSGWLMNTVKPQVEKDMVRISRLDSTKASIERVFARLTENDVSGASDEALSTGDLMLATLISQLPGDGIFVDDLRVQLAEWKRSGAADFIPFEYMRIYELLAGNVLVSPSSSSASSLSGPDRLEWERVWGLFLWYSSTREGEGIKERLDAYEKAWSSNRATRPLPSHLSLQTTSLDGPLDPAYQMLKLFIDKKYPIERILNPKNFPFFAGPHSTNGEGMISWSAAWTLMIILTRCLGIADFDDREYPGDVMEDGEETIVVKGNSVTADLVTVSFVEQLEMSGKWQDALFVALFLELSERREQVLRGLIERHIQQITPAKTEVLLNEYKIPQLWIKEARLNLALAQVSKPQSFLLAGTPTETTSVLQMLRLALKAHRFSFAHLLFVRSIAPECVIGRNWDLLDEITNEIRANGQLSELEKALGGEWEQAGQIFLAYRQFVQVAKLTPRMMGFNLQQISHSRGHLTLSSSQPSRAGGQEQDLVERAEKLMARINLLEKWTIGQTENRTSYLKASIGEMRRELGAFLCLRGSIQNIKIERLVEKDRWVRAAGRRFMEESLASVVS